MDSEGVGGVECFELYWNRLVTGRDVVTRSRGAVGTACVSAVVHASSGNLAQGLSQTQLEGRLTDHGALYWWTVNVLARNRKR